MSTYYHSFTYNAALQYVAQTGDILHAYIMGSEYTPNPDEKFFSEIADKKIYGPIVIKNGNSIVDNDNDQVKFDGENIQADALDVGNMRGIVVVKSTGSNETSLLLEWRTLQDKKTGADKPSGGDDLIFAFGDKGITLNLNGLKIKTILFASDKTEGQIVAELKTLFGG